VRVAAILREENAARLNEDYPIRGVDTPRARLILRYNTFAYTVDAPDRMTCPWPFSDIVARIDEVVAEGSGDASIRTCLEVPSFSHGKRRLVARKQSAAAHGPGKAGSGSLPVAARFPLGGSGVGENAAYGLTPRLRIIGIEKRRVVV
jgi:hypothetical protein